jgi:hypothetical protein
VKQRPSLELWSSKSSTTNPFAGRIPRCAGKVKRSQYIV